ncbi:MAG: LysM peptidoglycan-binding domain-containing protein, partial [Desulfobacteraceae bacterium]|nr:LysM peptidoglycan-binding domain-containing protein [Desulfobacteraceae bacterium]
MVKTAEVEGHIYDIDNKRVQAQTYIVQKGDSLWRILRKKRLLNQGKPDELRSILRQLNKSLPNLDLIYPGQEIVIPLRITSLPPHSVSQKPSPQKQAPVMASPDPEFEMYRVRPGDSLFRIAKRLYNIPNEDFYDEYIELFKKMNPTLTNLNDLYAGQVIKLPVYPTRNTIKPIEQAFSPKPAESIHIEKKEKVSKKANTLANDLGKIFAEVGEEWIQSGDHFVPLDSRGSINLKAASFPIIYLQNGQTVIVDLNNELPKDIGSLIESTWTNYQIVHLRGKEDLRSALARILSMCDYPKVFEKGEPLELKGDINFRVTGDLIVSLPENGSGSKPTYVVINLIDDYTEPTSWLVKRYFEREGIKIIDYPPRDSTFPGGIDESEIFEGGTDPFSLIEKLLALTNHNFSTQIEIPVYQSHKADLRVNIKVDFFLRIGESDAIIDLTGLTPEIVSFLEEHQFSYLSLSAEKDPLELVAKTLEFLNVQFGNGQHSFV